MPTFFNLTPIFAIKLNLLIFLSNKVVLLMKELYYNEDCSKTLSRKKGNR